MSYRLKRAARQPRRAGGVSVPAMMPAIRAKSLSRTPCILSTEGQTFQP